MLVGLDVISRHRHSAQARLAQTPVAVLTHNAALDGRGRSTLEVLRELGADIRVVFSPEHGFDGLTQAEVPVSQDDAGVAPGAVLVSLYGSDASSLSPKPEHFSDVRLLVIDLVDVGSRYYTYVWTALLAARAAASAGVPVLVLDRPNPLGGDPRRLEGRPQDPEFLSFVGLESVPIRHCLTIAELLVSQFNEEDRPLGPDGALMVVSCAGWERNRTANAWGRPFIPPSPNMPTADTALIYPGGCLIEGTNLSEGRGTATPFHAVGAPFVDGAALIQQVGPVPGAWLRPIRFRPSFEKHAGQVCGGVMIHVSDAQLFQPVRSGLRLIHAAHALYPEQFQFLTRTYEFESTRPAFDLLTGSARARELITSGATVEELVAHICPVDEEWIARVEAAEELALEVALR